MTLMRLVGAVCSSQLYLFPCCFTLPALSFCSILRSFLLLIYFRSGPFPQNSFARFLLHKILLLLSRLQNSFTLSPPPLLAVFLSRLGFSLFPNLSTLYSLLSTISRLLSSRCLFLFCPQSPAPDFSYPLPCPLRAPWSLPVGMSRGRVGQYRRLGNDSRL